MSQKKKFSKEQIASKVGVQPYMIAAWERQFEISPILTTGEPIYTKRQLATFRTIKELLYEKGLTPDAVKKQLSQASSTEESSAAPSPLFFIPTRKAATLSATKEIDQELPPTQPLPSRSSEFNQQLTSKLLKIKELLIKLNNTF